MLLTTATINLKRRRSGLSGSRIELSTGLLQAWPSAHDHKLNGNVDLLGGMNCSLRDISLAVRSARASRS